MSAAARAKRGERAAAVPSVKYYRGLLEGRAEELRRGLSARQAADIVRRPEVPMDFGDWCQKSHEEWLFVNQNRIALDLLRAVEAALRRIKDGRFGVCQRCGAPISHKRLAAIPWAECCVGCLETEPEEEETPAGAPTIAS